MHAYVYYSHCISVYGEVPGSTYFRRCGFARSLVCQHSETPVSALLSLLLQNASRVRVSLPSLQVSLAADGVHHNDHHHNEDRRFLPSSGTRVSLQLLRYTITLPYVHRRA